MGELSPFPIWKTNPTAPQAQTQGYELPAPSMICWSTWSDWPIGQKLQISARHPGSRMSRRSPREGPASDVSWGPAVWNQTNDSLQWTLASTDVWTKGRMVWLVGLDCSFHEIFHFFPILKFVSFYFLVFSCILFYSWWEEEAWRCRGQMRRDWEWMGSRFMMWNKNRIFFFKKENDRGRYMATSQQQGWARKLLSNLGMVSGAFGPWLWCYFHCNARIYFMLNKLVKIPSGSEVWILSQTTHMFPWVQWFQNEQHGTKGQLSW